MCLGCSTKGLSFDFAQPDVREQALLLQLLQVCDNLFDGAYTVEASGLDEVNLNAPEMLERVQDAEWDYA